MRLPPSPSQLPVHLQAIAASLVVGLALVLGRSVTPEQASTLALGLGWALWAAGGVVAYLVRRRRRNGQNGLPPNLPPLPHGQRWVPEPQGDGADPVPFVPQTDEERERLRSIDESDT